MPSLYSKGTRIEQNCAKNVKRTRLSDTEKERESGKSMVPLPLEKEREKEKKKEVGGTSVAIGGRTRAVISPGSTAIMLCSADRTKNQGAGFGDRRTGRIMLDGERAESIRCPSCVNRLDFPFKLSTLFVCSANCRRRVYTEADRRRMGRGVVGLN